MTDPLLHELLHGRSAAEKSTNSTQNSPLSHALSQRVDFLVDQILANDDPISHPLVSPEAYRLQLRDKLVKDLEFPGLADHLTSAFKILNSDQSCLDAATNQTLQAALKNAANILEEADPEALLQTDNYAKLLEISADCLNSIHTVGLFKFDQQLYKEAVDIYVFLTTLIPDAWEYWLRLGMCAQEGGYFDLALRAYSATSALNGDMIEPYLFNVECYILTEQTKLAQSTLVQAEQVAEQISQNNASDSSLEQTLRLKEMLQANLS